ncbi:hypothetical protein KI387_007525, partial [Taxus chinensis]
HFLVYCYDLPSLDMAIVPVYRRGGHSLQPWNEEGLSLLDSLFDPFTFGGMLTRDPFPLWDYSLSSLFSKDAQAVANTHVDWWESVDAHILQVDLPGVTKEEVEIVVENGRVLQVSGRRRKKAEAEEMMWRIGERSRVGYLRRLRLPANADVHQLKAELENGVLTITIPKLSSSSPSHQVRIVEIEE